MWMLLSFSGVFRSSMIYRDNRDTLSHPSSILTIHCGALWILFEGRTFFVYGAFFMLWGTAIASTTRTRDGRLDGFSLGLGIAKVNAENWQFGSFTGMHQTSFVHRNATEIKSIQFVWLHRNGLAMTYEMILSHYNVKRAIHGTDGSWSHQHYLIFGNCLLRFRHKLCFLEW